MNQAHDLDRLVHAAVLDCKKGNPTLARYVLGYALEEILPDWTILSDITCFYADQSVCVHYFCFCENGVKLIEFVPSEQKYDEARYRNVTALCATIRAHGAQELVDVLREQAASSRLLARKQRLEQAYEWMQALPNTHVCEVVWITPDRLPWFCLEQVSACTLQSLEEGCSQPVSQALQLLRESLHG